MTCEEYMSNSVNDAVKEDLYEEGLELGLTGRTFRMG